MDDLLFSCAACNLAFPAEPDSVVMLNKAVYLIDKTRPLDNVLPWEGVGEVKYRDGFQIENIFTDNEMGNSSIILCAACKKKYNYL